MKGLWRRLARLLRESEIRLAAAPLALDAIRPGDRLQIGPRLWRVERRRPDEASVELAGDGSRARLRFAAGDRFRPWIFDDGEKEIRLATRDLLHFPVAGPRLTAAGRGT